MALTTKEITDQLTKMMVDSHRAEILKLVSAKKIERRLAEDMNFAYSEGAKHMLDHLTKMGVVEYVKPEDQKPPE